MRPAGAEWRAYFEERGFVCPASLLELADLSVEVYVDIAGWTMGTPGAARADRERFLCTSARWPELAPYADMLSVLGRDGDLVLLARDGRVFGWKHDAHAGLAPLAASFDALLDALLDAVEGQRADWPLDF
jgi:hypothetical protein